MTIKVGDKLPAGTLQRVHRGRDGAAARSAPTRSRSSDLTKGKKIVIFGLPGAFTPTCSAKHVPSYLAAATTR
ncbi:MAG: redoxin family protein [Comamonadaceae bacterium]|nr:redoxin family protein [Comamonadaceae bacterium]